MAENNDFTARLDRFAEVLFLRNHAESARRTGICAYPMLVGDHKRLIRSSALRWLVREKPKLASLILKATTRPQSVSDLCNILTPEYGNEMAFSLAPILASVGIDTLADRARAADLPDEEKFAILTQLGMWKETMPILRKLVAESTGVTQVICKNNLAYSLAFGDSADLSEAKSIIDDVLKMESDQEQIAAVKDTLAFVLLRIGDFESAKAAIEDVVRIHKETGSDHPIVHHHAYQIYKAFGQNEKAERELRVACEMVGGPGRLNPKFDLRSCLIGEDEITSIIDDWLVSDSIISRIVHLLETELRPAFGIEAPSREREVVDRIETILRSAGLRVDRENIHVVYSLKTYVPDFALSDAQAAVEVKLVSSKREPKRIIAEMNDDKVAYLTRFPRLLFVVYDLGRIHDVERFKQGIEQVGVTMAMIKH